MVTPKSSAGIRLGIVNPLTLVGNEVKTILGERSFPFDRVVLLDSIGKDAGSLTDVNDEPTVVSAISQTELEDLDLVFFCGSPEANRPWIDRHHEDRFVAVDLSQPTALDDAKLVVAGVNLEDLTGADTLLVSPHPIAIPLVLILHQIEMVAKVELCAATVVQPASEFEQAGIEELAKQTIGVLNVQQLPQEIFDRQLAFNLYPAAARNEEFIVSQVRALGDRDAAVALQVTQGTVFHGHTFSLFIRIREAVDPARLLATLAANPAIALPEGDQTFGTIDAAGKDEVLIAEVRPDPSITGGFWVWAVCDNLRRSSALNAVLVAEKVLFGIGSPN
jgi:aspartate-semialdehyde dehydrogenase